MTELESSISSLRETISVGNVLLAKLEKAQKDLEESPSHIWEHLDVFESPSNTQMILVKVYGVPDQVFCLGACTGHHDAKNWLDGGKFLFNLKEKL